MNHLLTLLLALASCFTLNAQVRFEKDFNTREVDSVPQWLTAFAGRVFFSAEDGFSGRELWCHDPRINQTYQLANINPGGKHAQPRDLLELANELFFLADANDEQQIWRVTAGSTQAEQLFPATQFSQIRSLTIYDNALYFKGRLVNAEWHQTQLYRYQPATGVLEAVTANPGNYVLSISFHVMRVHQDKLYFLAQDTAAANLSELMSYDAAADEFTAIANQYTQNSQQIQVTDLRSVGDYLVMNVRDPENPNSGYLGLYQPGVDSIFIDLAAELWTGNPPSNRSIEVVGERLYLRLRGQRTLLRSYNLATREVQTIQGVTDFSVPFMQELDGQLMYTTTPSSNTNEYVFRSVDPITNTAGPLADFSTVQPSIFSNFPGNTFDYFASLNGSWYYRGFSTVDNGELHRYQPATANDERITDIQQGNASSSPVVFQPTVDGNLLVRIVAEGVGTLDQVEWVEYQTADQSYRQLLPELEWEFYSKVYQFPGYLVACQVTYNGVEYDAVAYDSLSQIIVPMVTSVDNCDDGFGRVSGSFVYYNSAIYFTHCDGQRAQLFRHDIGVAGAEMVSGFTDKSLLIGSITDETMGRLGDDLIFPVSERVSNFFNHDLYRYDGNEVAPIDLGQWRIREAWVVQTPAAVYLSVMEGNDLNNFYPAYLTEADNDLHFITYQGDTVEAVFALRFDQRDSSVYFVYQNLVLRHHPEIEEAELYYTIPDELSRVGSPYLFNGVLYFVASETNSLVDQELYAVPDLSGVPIQVTELASGSVSPSFANLTGIGERLYFAANDGLRGRELWSYQPNCFTIDLAVTASNINWPTGEVMASPQGGIPPYAYAWNTGDSTALLSNVAAGFYEVTITDSFGCSISQNTWVETNGVISSNNDDALAQQFSAVVYPNPFRDQLNICLDGSVPTALIVRIFDRNGRLIAQRKQLATAAMSIEVGQLPAGSYVAQLLTETGQTVLVRQVVKQ